MDRRSRGRMRASIFALVVAAAFVEPITSPKPVAAADSPGDSAKKLYAQGKTHYQLGEYKEALGAFKEAYRLVQNPALLYNVAQCHRLLQNHEDALRAYQSYLRD